MKLLLSTKAMLLTALCVALAHPLAYAKTMYKWVDTNGKVSFSDQVPPDKADLGHDELDKNAQLIKTAAKAKTKAELEFDKRVMLLKKQRDQLLVKQKAHDKKLLSNFLTVESMDAAQVAKRKAQQAQQKELQETIKKTEAELADQHAEAADYERKNKKVSTEVLAQIETSKKKIADTQAEIKKLQEQIASLEKEYASDKARFLSLKQPKSGAATSTAGVSSEKDIPQPGLFSCDTAELCEKAWPIAKEFVKSNSVAKITVDTDTLFMSEDPVSDTDLNLSISKVASEGGKTEIFLDIRCTEAATAKGLCAGSKVDDLRHRFTDYLKTKLKAPATAPKTAAVSATAAAPAAAKK